MTDASVFPAHAGMSPGRVHSVLSQFGFPRSRGDEPHLGPVLPS